MNLYLDIETTGLPPKNSNWKIDYMRFPHIVSISWIYNGKENDYIIKPDGYLIPDEATKIHGITNEMAINDGFDLRSVLLLLLIDSAEANKIIGHNVYFDISIIKANVLRKIKNDKPVMFSKELNANIDIFNIANFNNTLHKDKRIDTMMKSIKFVNAKHKDGRGGKWPTLIELYDKLFNDSFPAHNSMDDVRATKRCYEKLVKLGVI